MSQSQGVSASSPAAAAAAPSQPGRRSKVAVGQMTSVGDQLANFNTCKQLAEQAAAAGCSMLFLPECFSFIGASQPESLSKAEPLDGPAMARYRQLARDTGLWLSLGGFQETGPDPEHLYNCHVVLDASGATAAAYRKVHLFDVDVPDGPVLMESRTTAPGDKLVACDSPAGRLGLSVCYDLRFPEVYQTLTWGMGAEVLLVPSAFTKVTGKAHWEVLLPARAIKCMVVQVLCCCAAVFKHRILCGLAFFAGKAHWEVLLRARAIECQCFVIAAAQAGTHNEKRESYGHALIIDPWGEVIGRLEDPQGTGIAVAELDFELLSAVRTKMPIREHRAKGRSQLAGQLT
ncbi:hypothetical protein OEZ86_014137 [Tetradesmus obliquus]|nr:hypothetical protein OEZ86_014137 [Tetradesmus obliquus]